MSQPDIVVICGDPGGANAVAPVIEALRAENRLAVHAMAYRQAHTLWCARDLSHESIPDDMTFEKIRAQLQRLNARLVLTGTSVNPFEFEKQYIAAAHELGIPTLAVLDFWSNYHLRFSYEQDQLAYLPDRIAVMDDLARDEMIAEGFPPARLIVAGHPALDSLEAHSAAFTPSQRDATRKNLSVGPEDWLVLYASQPPSFSDHDEGTHPPWLDRLRTVGELLTALAELSHTRGKRITLLIRPHPREDGEIYRNLSHGQVSIIVSSEGNSRDLALAADLVAGMNTMFLVESAQLGRPTLSIRLHLPLPDDFPPNRSNLTHPVYLESTLKPALISLLEESGNRRRPTQPGNAGRNVAKLAYSMLGI
ncbi:MAG: hypothetical protein K8H84_00245 [Sulfuricella denitrificans]|nr:hypothetical protein [Sulfuricella denitrificans]